MPDYDRERKTCWVKESPGRHICGEPRWGWTNYMEPLCQNHFQQRRVIQNLLVILSGCNNWGGLIWARRTPEQIEFDNMLYGEFRNR